MGQYIALTKDNFDAENKGVLLVDFWAPWCNPCKMLSPLIDKLATEYEGRAKICKINTDEEQELSEKFGIRSIPTILFIKDGEIKDTLVGAQGEAIIREKLNALL